MVQGVMGSIPISYPKYGEMAEWLIASVLKTELLERVTGVRTPLSPPKTPRLTESTCPLWCVNLTKKSSRLWGRIHKSEIHITPYKRCSLTRGSSVRYVGNYYEESLVMDLEGKGL